jgi:Immunity protein 39
MMAHNRKLVFGVTALTLGKIDDNMDGPALDAVRDDLEHEMINSGFLEGAPFVFMGVVFRYGLQYEVAPHYFPIGKKDGFLDVAIEIDTHDLLDATLEQMKAIFRKTALICIIHVGKRYKLKIERMEQLLAEL